MLPGSRRQRLYGFHTIAALVYHMDYFIAATLKVMQDGPLDAKDKFSFDHPPIMSQEAGFPQSRGVDTSVDSAASCTIPPKVAQNGGKSAA